MAPAPAEAAPPPAPAPEGSAAKRALLALLKPLFWAAGAAAYGVLRALEPWKRLQIGMLHYDRIGHLAMNTERFLRTRAADPARARVQPVFLAGPAANAQLLEMIGRRVPVLRGRAARSFYHNALMPFIRGTRFHAPLPWTGHEHDFFRAAPPQLAFSEDEEARGRALLKELGVPEGASFICFHARDKAYLGARQGQWSYHDYRDCDVERYMEAAGAMARHGLYALRMGSVVEKPLAARDPRVIDYARRDRSDFADVYLLARCKFFLGNTAGIVCVPPIFDRPVAAANYTPLGFAPWSPRDIFIPKTYRKDGRDLAFREIILLGASLWQDSRLFAEAGIEAVENTAEDIRELAEEMDARLDGRWTPEPEDEDLQRRYRSLFPADHPVTGFPARVGAAFLRKHKELLT